MQQQASQATVETSVLKKSRTACHKARSAFFDCVEECSLDYTVDIEIPNKCRQARKAYEELCRDSWVHHFDTLKEKELKFYQKKKAFEEQLAMKTAAADDKAASQLSK